MTTELIIRVVVAALLGGVIGLEREYRAKEAGFRTHFLVALGSALLMILSQYGFEQALADHAQDDRVRLDMSRIAAQVVSGIGFIGAGTIIFQCAASPPPPACGSSQPSAWPAEPACTPSPSPSPCSSSSASKP